jgi:uncharacterized membrane protein YccC
LRAELHPGSLILRHSLRMAICVSFAYLLTRLMHIPYGYWMTMTVVIIQQPYLATTWTRGLERVIGTVLGGGLAALLGMAFHSQSGLLLLIFLTPLFVLILDLTHPGERELTLAGVRAMNTVIGGVIALAGVSLIWPASGANRLRLDVAAAIQSNGRFASLALAWPTPSGPSDIGRDDPSGVDGARRSAGLASNVAEASRQRAALESWWRRSASNDAANVLGLLRRLAGTATTLWLQSADAAADAATEPSAAGERFETARWTERATAELAAAVRDGAPTPALPSRPEMLRSAAERVLVGEIEDLYRAAATLRRRSP